MVQTGKLYRVKTSAYVVENLTRARALLLACLKKTPLTSPNSLSDAPVFLVSVHHSRILKMVDSRGQFVYFVVPLDYCLESILEPVRDEGSNPPSELAKACLTAIQEKLRKNAR